MATFYLIRHGDKEKADVMVGRLPGIHLTKLGHRQARAISARLSDAPIARIFASPLERAVETAAPLAKAKKLRIETRPALTEVDTGEWTGMPLQKLKRTRAWRELAKFPAGRPIPGGETLPEVQARIVSELIQLNVAYPREHIAVFTHEDPIRLALCHFIGAPMNAYEHITVKLGSICTLRLNVDCAVLERIDELPLPR
jgi:broad specificity phosphatase PhoE